MHNRKRTLGLFALLMIMTAMLITACSDDDLPDEGTTEVSVQSSDSDTGTSDSDEQASEDDTAEAESSDITHEARTEAGLAAETGTENASAEVKGTGPFSTFTATDLNGNNVDESVLSGSRLTMINVWATYCGPCLNEMPDLGELSAEYDRSDFQIIGIPIDTVDYYGNQDSSQVELAKELVSETGADYLHIIPSAELISSALSDIQAVPTTIFVDSLGNQIGDSVTGSMSKSDWKSEIDTLLEQVK